MSKKPPHQQSHLEITAAGLTELRARLQAAEEMVAALRSDGAGKLLQGADLPNIDHIRAERDQLARIVDTAHYGIICKTLDGVIISWNQGAQALYGYTAEEIIGQAIDELEIPARKGEIAALIERVRSGELVVHYETQGLAKMGAYLNVSLTLSPISDASGTLNGISTIARDISARHAVEKDLHESQRRYRKILDGVQMLAVMLDAEDRITYCNAYFLNVVGWASEDLIGQNWFERCMPADTAQSARDTYDLMLSGKPEGRYHENEILTRAGERRLIRWNNTPLYVDDGRAMGTASLGSDITEYRRATEALKVSERRFRALIENVSDVIVVIGADKTIRFLNAAAEAISGYAPWELIGQSFTVLLHPDEIELAESKLAELFVQPGLTAHLNLRHRHRNGSWLTMSTTASNQLATPGIEGFVVTLHDVTELEQVAWALGRRVKEQRCLYEVAALAARLELSEEALLAEIPALLVEALAWPEMACARVQLGSSSYESPDFVDTARRLDADLSIDGVKEGGLALCYREEPPESAEELFLAEERALIESVATILSRTLAAKRMGMQLQFANMVIERSATVLFRWEASEEWPVHYVSDNVSQWGYEPTDLLSGATPFASIIHPDDLSRVGEEVESHIARGDLDFAQEYRIVKPSGEVIWVDDRTTVERDAAGTVLLLQGVVMDITVQKRAREVVVRSEQKYRGLFESSRDAIMTMFPPDWRFSTANAASMVLFAAKDAASFAALGPADVSPERQPDGALSSVAAMQMIQIAMQQGSHFFEWQHCSVEGKSFPATVLLTRLEVDGQIGVQTTIRDITDQKEGEKALHRLNRALKTLSAGDSAVVRATSEQELLQGMCDAIVNVGEYRMAWVGQALDDAVKTLRPLAWAGNGMDYVKQASISWGEGARGQGPAGRCIRALKPQVGRDIDNDSSMLPWREAALESGYKSMLALPLRVGSEVFGGLMIYAAELDAFDSEEQALLGEMATDLSFGIETLRTRQSHEDGLQRLARSLDATVESLARTVELRDPYTAGHQRRVAKIAVAVAGAMELSDDRIKGLSLAASIHDIGKVSIPAEILSKPTQLSDVEYQLVQSHAQAGFELLKDIDFPWPVAEMIHQHHERVDGSGYPQGLKGEQILMEARILAVADVIESMASHRPYRAAKGIEAALAEIEAGRGRTYDAEVADASLKLFREDGFELPVQ